MHYPAKHLNDIISLLLQVEMLKNMSTGYALSCKTPQRHHISLTTGRNVDYMFIGHIETLSICICLYVDCVCMGWGGAALLMWRMVFVKP